MPLYTGTLRNAEVGGAGASVAACASIPPMTQRATRIALPDLVGSHYVCAKAGINRSTLTRHVAQGLIVPLGRLNTGKNGALIFTRAEADRYAAWRRAAA